MFGYWTDFERTFAAMDELRRKMEQALGDGDGEGLSFDGAWPRVSLWDAGDNLVLKADLPGVSEKEVQLQLTEDVLTLSGTRKVEQPQGYSVHRQERLPMRFSRSFTLPSRVQGNDIGATLKDGVLTVTLPKTPESQPRQITIKTA